MSTQIPSRPETTPEPATARRGTSPLRILALVGAALMLIFVVRNRDVSRRS
ncbi:hypothetical protein [Pseudonocardia xinjiangensis]|uniref:MYXO-CTERM domain-containing protein n=1 Tax=Pseudonocardia xinjiangensis TaxID=75289 RepID=A0ABX1RSQ2_9PSEU|nr:hypothetical protein [Pseudonocardia xinjiangensis]NMH82649.1 hypothetical protein [Pseudonocardia xinjiangensis]